jgi:hypothetical protein
MGTFLDFRSSRKLNKGPHFATSLMLSSDVISHSHACSCLPDPRITVNLDKNMQPIRA